MTTAMPANRIHNPGAMRHVVDLQVPVTVVGSDGSVSTTWHTQATLYASVETLSGGESSVAGQLYPEATHVVTVRYRDALYPRLRLLWGGRTLDILGVVDSYNTRRILDLYCRESIGQEVG